MYKTPSNKEIAALLKAIADSLEIRSVDEFRVRAFRGGARNVEKMEIDVADAVSEGRLDILPGIGKRLGAVIDEYVRTGASTDLEEAQEGIPPGLFEVLEIRGLGPKTVGKLFDELKIDGVDSLEQMAASGELRSLPGMGPKKVEKILLEIEKLRARRGRRLLADSLSVAQPILAKLLGVEDVAHAALVGAARRGVPVVGRISLLIAAGDPGPVIDVIRSILPKPESSERSVSGTFEDGFEVRINVCTPTKFSLNLVFATGSDSHCDALRSIAGERGVELENGADFANEEEVYEALGLPLIPPELREGHGEIEAARNGALPELLAAKDLQGDLHCHTRWSDGAHSIEQMAEAARELGRAYLAISDHSRSLTVAHGLEAVRVAEQSEAVEEANRAVDGIDILHGTEVDILTDGSLDYPDELLSELDWVSAAVHSGFGQSSEDMTKRVVAAIRNPHVDSVAHPTGRLLNSRDGYELDIDAVLEAAAETGTALEINAMPDRLDLPEEPARKAARMGVPIVINTDSHSMHHLDYLTYGVTAGRRSWLRASDVLNTRGVEALRVWREERRRTYG